MPLPEKIILLIICLYIIRTLRNVLYHTYTWQLKEYRVDRMLSYLKTKQGRKWIIGPLTLIKWVLLLLPLVLYYLMIFFYWLAPGYIWDFHLEGTSALIDNLIFLYGPAIIYSFEGLRNLQELSLHKLRKPTFTIKAMIIIAFTLLAVFMVVHNHISSFDGYPLPLALLMGDKIIGPVVTFLVLFFSIPTILYRKYTAYKAKVKISKYKELIVIGITGSYGKSSTKEFLSHILSRKYNVLKTPENINTEIGVAQTILTELKPEHEVFVVEMGAYKKGEIKAICEMVHPEMGILTGINEQHIELFGSIQNTMKAKYELIASLPGDGTAIVNGNNEKCVEMGEWGKRDGKNVIMYAVKNEKTGSPIESGMTGYYASNVKTSKDGIEFDLSLSEKSVHTSVKLFGKHNVENILAAAVAAHDLGMSPKDIASAIQSIVPHDKNMKKITLPSGAYAIDDTYNSNPDSVLAILEYMKLYKGKKVLVLMPLIELGEQSSEIHKKLGEEIAQVCNHLIVTNTNYSEALKTGIGSNKKIQFDIATGTSAVELLKKYTGKEDIIGFEGREAGTVLKNFLVIPTKQSSAHGGI